MDFRSYEDCRVGLASRLALQGDWRSADEDRDSQGQKDVGVSVKMPVKCGEDFVRDAEWRPVVRDRDGALAVGRRIMPSDLKAMGFGVSVWEGDSYFRVSFGRKS